MKIRELVDELYEAFAGGIGEPLGERARDIPRALHLAARAKCPWSDVFSHEITLGAPALFAENMDLAPHVVRDGVLAHTLAVIGAFGTDRIEDPQIVASPELLEVLARARLERDKALKRILGSVSPPDCNYGAADALSVRAIRAERKFLTTAHPVDLEAYERESLGKQAPGIVASLALAQVAGWNASRCQMLKKTLESIWIGLQLYEDVVDWEGDLERDGSWVACLARGTRHRVPSLDRVTQAAFVRTEVLQSGVLLRMLSRAMRHMSEATQNATSLGAIRLAAWTAEWRQRFVTLCSGEAQNAGYAVRAHALSAWAGAVLT